MQDTFGMPEPEKLSPVLASRMSRLLAALTDSVALQLPLFFAWMELTTDRVGMISFVALAVTAGVLVVQIVLLSRDGQTIGKKILRIRIVRIDTEQNAGFLRAALLRFILNNIIVYATNGFYGLVDALFIFREDRRCLHDLIAGTHVIDLRPLDEIERSNLGVWERYNKAGGTDSGAL